MALPFRRQIRQGYPGAGSRMLNYGALASAWLSFDSHFHYRPEKEIGWISRSGSIQLVLFISLLRRTAEFVVGRRFAVRSCERWMCALTVEGWKRWFVAELQAGVHQIRRITFQLANQVFRRRVQERNGGSLNVHKKTR